MPKNQIYVTKPTLPPFDEFVEELRKIWDSHILTNYGPNHKILQEKLANYLGVNNVSLFVNGHQALEIAISTLRLTGEVITTPFTFASTTHAIIRCGLTPVFCDIRPDTLNIDENRIEELITEKTSAIIPVHVYGNPCAVETIGKIAKQHNLKVIYDAAHAFGVTINGKGIVNFGDMSMFSFHATKVFNTIEGGALTFTDSNFEREIYLRQNFGIANAEEILLPGSNAKMNELQALVGILNLNHLEEAIKNRTKAYDYYCYNLSRIKGIRPVLNEDPSVIYTHPYFPVLVEDSFSKSRDDLAEFMQQKGVFPRKYFYPLITDFACYKGKFKGITPVASDAASRVLCLPMSGDIDISDIDLIVDIIKMAQKS